jgi:hypothetical protein
MESRRYIKKVTATPSAKLTQRMQKGVENLRRATERICTKERVKEEETNFQSDVFQMYLKNMKK